MNNESEEQSSQCPYHANEMDELTPYGDDITYDDYLKITEILDLQEPLSDPAHHDEMLFIIIHQAYELWFKLILHELEYAIEWMEKDEILQADHHVKRAVSVMDLLVSQIHILETMRPADFLEFRDNLNPASGFQSVQFREIEFLCGLKNEQYIQFFESEPSKKEQLNKRLQQKDLRMAYYELIRSQGWNIPENCSKANLREHDDVRDQALEALTKMYRNPKDHLEIYSLTESLLDLDQKQGLWRDHHVRVVERIIGKKEGTGGSSGVAYLESTTGKRFFPFLWTVRSHL